MNEIDWLRGLNATLNSRLYHRIYANEWDMILHLVIGKQLPCSIEASRYRDFNFVVFNPPAYPGLSTEALCRISRSHFAPMEEIIAVDLMENMYRVASTKRNIEMLDLFNIPHPITKYKVWDYTYLVMLGRESANDPH